MIMDYSMNIVIGVIALNYLIAFYLRFWYINKNTDHINLIDRWVELQRMRDLNSKRN